LPIRGGAFQSISLHTAISEEYYATMTAENMLAIGCLSQQIGKEYFNKLLGVTNGVAKMTTATRLAKICHKCSIDMKRRQVCNAAVAEWRAGTEKSPASKPPQSKNCKCHVCLLYLKANPPQPPKPRAKAKKASAVKAAAVKAAVVKAAVAGAQSWVEQQEDGEVKAEQGRQCQWMCWKARHRLRCCEAGAGECRWSR
jgi:hypothetical protein